MKSEGLRTRVLILAALLGVVFVGLAGRLAYLQIFRHTALAQMAERQYSRTVVLPWPRVWRRCWLSPSGSCTRP